MRARPLGLLGALALVLALPSVGQAQDPDSGDFNLMRYTPAPGPMNYFMVEGAQTPGHIQGSAGLVLDYAHRPFVLWMSEPRERTR